MPFNQLLTEGGECLVAALKRRCRNLLKRRRRRKNYSRRCEINFLPLVHLSSESRRPQQRLVCRNAGPEFASCPSLRSINDTSHLFCNPLRENSKRCETSHESIQTSCRVFETCDQVTNKKCNEVVAERLTGFHKGWRAVLISNQHKCGRLCSV